MDLEADIGEPSTRGKAILIRALASRCGMPRRFGVEWEGG
jgi:hypothetical protein